MIEKKNNPLAAKSRLPFAPMIRPGLAGGTGGISALIYGLAALLLGGYALYQVRVQYQSFGSWRVLLVLAVAAYFAIRAALMVIMSRPDKGDGDEKTDEGA